MSQVFTEDGTLVPVTVIEAGPCAVLSVKERSVQLGFDAKKESRVNKPMAGLFKKASISARRFIREVPRQADKEYKVGDELKVDLFKPGDFVDVTGISIGKGFQGGMKRWNWHGGPQTHGSMSHRRVGSIGSTTTPGRVWKGHHMPGHMGAARKTIQNLKVIKADTENNLLLVKGAIPGNKNSYVIIKSAVKQKKAKAQAPAAAKAKPGAKK